MKPDTYKKLLAQVEQSFKALKPAMNMSTAQLEAYIRENDMATQLRDLLKQVLSANLQLKDEFLPDMAKNVEALIKENTTKTVAEVRSDLEILAGHFASHTHDEIRAFNEHLGDHDHKDLRNFAEKFAAHNIDYDHEAIANVKELAHAEQHSLGSHGKASLQELETLVGVKLALKADVDRIPPPVDLHNIPYSSHVQEHLSGIDRIPVASEDSIGLMTPGMVKELKTLRTFRGEKGKVPAIPTSYIGGSGAIKHLIDVEDVANNPTTGQGIIWNQGSQSWELGYLPLVSGEAVTDNAIARFDGTTGLLIQDSGVTIDDSDNIDGVNAIQFVLSPTHTHSEGSIHWEDSDKSLNVDTDKEGVSVHVGQDMIMRVTNKTGADLSKGDVVYVDGAQGSRPTIALADADITDASHRLIGIVAADIADNATGYVVTQGILRGVDTSLYAAGTILYLSQTAGELTSTAPTSPAHNVCVAMVITQGDSDSGAICVRPNVGGDLNSLHDVLLTNQAANDFLIYDATNSYWKNMTLDDVRGMLISDITLEPTGFPNRTDSTMSFDDGTLTFSIAPVGNDFTIYSYGNTFTFTEAQTVAITDTEGLWFIYFDTDGVLTASQTPWTFGSGIVFVSLVYWDATNSSGIGIADERHGLAMPWSTHEYLHDHFGSIWGSGLTLSVISDGDGSLDAHAEIQAISAGEISDEDIEFSIPEQTTYEIWYKTGASAYWRKNTASAAAVYKATTRPYFNEYTGGAWQLTEATSNRYILMHVFATNAYDATKANIIIMGEDQYITKAEAQTAALTEINNLTTGSLPTAEFVPIATYIVYCFDTFTNTYNAALVQTGEGDDYIDWRFNERTGTGASPTEHGNLTGLGDDDHTQYALLAGRASGQTLNGDTASGGNLTLNSTSNATKGTVYIGGGLSVSGETLNFSGSGISGVQVTGTDVQSLSLRGGSDGDSATIFLYGSTNAIFPSGMSIYDSASNAWFIWSKALSKLTISGTIAATALEGPLTGNVTGDVSGSSGSCTGNAATASQVYVTDNESTNENNLIAFIANAADSSGNQALEMDGDFHYNPSTGTLTATLLAGTLSTAAQGNITSVGTLTALSIDFGSDATGDIIYRNSDGDLARLAIGSEDDVLTVSAGGLPNWEASAAAATPTAITVANEASDTTCFPAFFTAATGDLGPKTNAGLTFNSSTAVLTATGFAGPLTGNVTGNVTGDVSGSSGSCTGNAATATQVYVTDNESTNENNLITFVANAGTSSGNHGLEMDGNLYYNPSTGTVTSTAFAGSLTGNVNGSLTLAANNVILETALSLTTGQYCGTYYLGIAGYSCAFGDVMRLAAADGRWELADKDTEANVSYMVGMALQASSDGNPVAVLLDGFVCLSSWSFTNDGAPLFIGDDGAMTETASSTTGDFVKCVGHVLDASADIVHFSPAKTWVEVA